VLVFASSLSDGCGRESLKKFAVWDEFVDFSREIGGGVLFRLETRDRIRYIAVATARNDFGLEA
jgi:hypothetical protein